MFPEPSNNIYESIRMAQEIVEKSNKKGYTKRDMVDCAERAFYNGVIACLKGKLLYDSDANTFLVSESAEEYGKKVLEALEN